MGTISAALDSSPALAVIATLSRSAAAVEGRAATPTRLSASSFAGMPQPVPVLGKRAFANRGRCGLVSDAGRHLKVPVAWSVCFVTDHGRCCRRSLVRYRRHDRVDESLGRPTPPGTATRPHHGTDAGDACGGRTDDYVSAAVPHGRPRSLLLSRLPEVEFSCPGAKVMSSDQTSAGRTFSGFRRAISARPGRTNRLRVLTFAPRQVGLRSVILRGGTNSGQRPTSSIATPTAITVSSPGVRKEVAMGTIRRNDPDCVSMSCPWPTDGRVLGVVSIGDALRVVPDAWRTNERGVEMTTCQHRGAPTVTRRSG
jgi:hypothetical protein